MTQPECREFHQRNLPGVGNYQLGPFRHCLFHPQSYDGMIFSSVGADNKQRLVLSNLGNRIRHCARTEFCGQTGHSSAVSVAGAVVDIVGA